MHTVGLLASNDMKCGLYMQDYILDFPFFSRKVPRTRSEPVSVTVDYIKACRASMERPDKVHTCLLQYRAVTSLVTVLPTVKEVHWWCRATAPQS